MPQKAAKPLTAVRPPVLSNPQPASPPAQAAKPTAVPSPVLSNKQPAIRSPHKRQRSPHKRQSRSGHGPAHAERADYAAKKKGFATIEAARAHETYSRRAESAARAKLSLWSQPQLMPTPIMVYPPGLDSQGAYFFAWRRRRRS